MSENIKPCCPECGSDQSAVINTHPELCECLECGHPRDRTSEEMRIELIDLGYNPDGLIEKLKRLIKGVSLEENNVIALKREKRKEQP